MTSARLGLVLALAAASLLAAKRSFAQTTITSVFRSGNVDANGIPISQMRDIAADRDRRAGFLGHTDVLMQWDGVAFTVRLQTGAALPPSLNGTFNRFFRPALNDAGEIVFRSTLNSTSLDEGIFIVTAAGTTIHVNAAVPGKPERSASDINNAQQVVWQNRDLGTSRTLYRWALGANTLIASRGGAAPGGGSWDRFGDHPVISDSGHVAFVAELQGANDGVFVWDPVSQLITPIAQAGDPTPITAAIYAAFDRDQVIAINPAGDVVFTAPLSGGSVAAGVFLFERTTASVRPVATDGTVVPGAPGPLLGIDDDYVGANGAGQLAFKAPVGPALQQLILVHADGSLAILSPPFSISTSDFAPRLTSSRDTVWEAGIGIDATDTPTATQTVVDRRTLTPVGLDVISHTPTINNAGVVVFQGDHRQLYAIDGSLPEGRVKPGDQSPRGPGSMVTVLERHAMDGRSIAFQVADDGVCAPAALGLCIPHAIGWLRTNAAGISRVAASGDAAPASIGGTIALPNPGPVAVKGRTVWFMSVIDGGSVAAAIFRVRRPGVAPDVIIGAGDPVPGRPLAFDTFDTNKEMKARSRHLVFQATTTPFAEGIVRCDARGSNGVTVALSGDPAPGTGSVFELFGRMDMNRQGDVVFAASTVSAVSGVFLWDSRSQTTSKIALDGEPTPVGGLYDFSDFASMPLGIGRQQVIAFAALSTGPVNSDVLFRVDAGVVSAVAVQGDPALGGGTFAGFNLGTPMNIDRRYGMATHQLSLDGAEYELQSLLLQ